MNTSIVRWAVRCRTTVRGYEVGYGVEHILSHRLDSKDRA